MSLFAVLNVASVEYSNWKQRQDTNSKQVLLELATVTSIPNCRNPSRCLLPCSYA